VINQPKLIVFSGPPCSGKSTLAEELHRRTGIIHLELDRLRERLLPESRQSEPDRDTTYRAMHLIAEYLLTASQSVILDATYARPLHRTALQQLASSSAAQLRIVQCTVSADVAIRRFKERIPGHGAVDLTEQRVGMLVTEYPQRDDALKVSTESGMEFCLERILGFI
jgi:predicted kinase